MTTALPTPSAHSSDPSSQSDTSSHNPSTPPNRPRQIYEVAPLELFFDLVFVFAVSQLSNHLLTNLSWRGAIETLVLLRAVFGVWYTTSWVATMIPAEEPRTRRMVLAVMLLGLFMNASVTGAFDTSIASWVFVIPLVLIQVGRTVWTVVNAPDPIFREHFSRALVWFVAMAPLWLAGAAVDPQSRLLWWGLAAVIDQIGAWLGHPLPGHRLHTEDVGFAGGHMLERCRLFLIIALGETVLTTGTAISAVIVAAPMTSIAVVTGTAALVGTIALWTLGFGRAGSLTQQYMEETRDPVRASRHAVSVLMVMVAGLIAVAVANEEVIAHPYEETSIGLNLLLYGGPILFLLAQCWYFWVLLKVRERLRLIGSAALLIFGFAMSVVAVQSYVALIVVSTCLVALAILDQAMTR